MWRMISGQWVAELPRAVYHLALVVGVQQERRSGVHHRDWRSLRVVAIKWLMLGCAVQVVANHNYKAWLTYLVGLTMVVSHLRPQIQVIMMSQANNGFYLPLSNNSQLALIIQPCQPLVASSSHKAINGLLDDHQWISSNHHYCWECDEAINVRMLVINIQ